MPLLANLVSLFAIASYVALMRLDPMWGWISPRGGLVLFAGSVVAANLAIRYSVSEHGGPLGHRFEIGVAGWIWLVVQSIAGWYLYLAWPHA